MGPNWTKKKNAVDMRVFHEDWFVKSILFNRTPSRLEAHLIYKHTQKPDFLISNARWYSWLYSKYFGHNKVDHV